MALPTTVPIMAHVPPGLKQRLREHAARNGVSMSTVVAQLITAHMELADGLAREDTPEEAANMTAITGEHPAINLDME